MNISVYNKCNVIILDTPKAHHYNYSVSEGRFLMCALLERLDCNIHVTLSIVVTMTMLLN